MCSVLVDLGSSNLLVVDDKIPFQAVAIEWNELKKCWCIRVMQPDLVMLLEEQPVSMKEGQVELKPSTSFTLGSHYFAFSTAIDNFSVSLKHE